jgi:hypothetical protein
MATPIEPIVTPAVPAVPAVNANGYPDATPVADMAPEHQVAYWRTMSRQHEARSKAAPDATELETLRAAATELATRKAAELSDTERLQAEAATARAEADAAKAEAASTAADLLRLTVAAEKGLTPTQAARLKGATKEELESDADELKALFAPAADAARGPHHVAGAPVGGAPKTVAAGADRYKAQFGTTT